jgi:hypothetical protein
MARTSDHRLSQIIDDFVGGPDGEVVCELIDELRRLRPDGREIEMAQRLEHLARRQGRLSPKR